MDVSFWVRAALSKVDSSLFNRAALLPMLSKAPLFIRLSTTRLFTARRSTLSQKSRSEVNLPSLFPDGDDILHGSDPDILYRHQSESYPVADDGEIFQAFVHIRGHDLYFHLLAFGYVHAHLVRIACDGCEKRRHELHWIIRL